MASYRVKMIIIEGIEVGFAAIATERSEISFHKLHTITGFIVSCHPSYFLNKSVCKYKVDNFEEINNIH